MTGPGPFDSATAQSYVRELLESDATVSELASVLEADAAFDLELAQEQYALAAIVAEMFERRTSATVAGEVAAALRTLQTNADLAFVAHACMNRLLGNPFHPLWRDHADGGIAIKREARALRARLHRACSE